MNRETFDLDGAALTLSEANVLIDLRRSRMIGEAMETPDPDPDRQTLRFAFANCTAPVVDWGGRAPLTFEEFIDLKGKQVDGWLEISFRLNHDWEVRSSSEDEQQQEQDEAEKKV